MRRSQLFTKTSKTHPADEESRNAQLLIQAGFVHKQMAGAYAYLPMGRRVLNKIADIVREEMNAIGGQEVSMTVLQPKDIWEKTDRWDDKKVDNWFKSKLANGTEVGIGLTHEEPIITALKPFITSYKDLPQKVYQIQSKFRNELRAKSGLMRGREFLMKDMYTFSRSEEEHRTQYEHISEAYSKVYDRLGIGDVTYRTFASGGIFSKFSDEFQTLSSVGEDTIFVHEGRRIAVNQEVMTDENLKILQLPREELVEKTAVEVGNIFSLGSKYTNALDLYYTDESGERQSIVMGCYGIGVSRLVGMLAEHFADDRGLVWPMNVAPYQVYLASIGESDQVVQAADKLYSVLVEKGVEVLYDDRKDARAGEKFADADLIGIPLRLVVSEKTLEQGKSELKKRTETEVQLYGLTEVCETIVQLTNKLV